MSTLAEARTQVYGAFIEANPRPKKTPDPAALTIEKLMRDTVNVHSDLTPGSTGTNIFKTFYCRRAALLKPGS